MPFGRNHLPSVRLWSRGFQDFLLSTARPSVWFDSRNSRSAPRPLCFSLYARGPFPLRTANRTRTRFEWRGSADEAGNAALRRGRGCVAALIERMAAAVLSAPAVPFFAYQNVEPSLPVPRHAPSSVGASINPTSPFAP